MVICARRNHPAAPGHPSFERRGIGVFKLCVLLFLSLALLAGCAGRYFHDAGAPPAEVPRFTLAEWPWREIWTGVIFNGEKIGFTHLRLRPAPDAPARFEIEADAVIALRFLGLEKEVTLRSLDVVRDDLTLERFEYRYVIDGTPMHLTGRSDGARLAVTVVTGNRPFDQEFTLAGKLYPASAINLIPAHRGLRVGAEYAYTVYDGENQKLGEVTQKVPGWETSELFQGPAFKVVTWLHGLESTTWMDDLARPLFELALNGVMISALESEAQARRYLASASLNKEEALVEFSRVKPDRPIPRARELSALDLTIRGLPPGTEFPPGAGQTCAPGAHGMRCEIRAILPADLPRGSPGAPEPRHLQASITVQTGDPAIRAAAQKIVGGEQDRLAQVRMLVAWIQANVTREPVDVFSALDVLASRRAECQGHAWLYAALARSAGIPTRVVGGLVYSEDLGGFLYHSWNESQVDSAWLPVDPTFGQVGVDASHVRMLEGDTLADLLPMVNWVGRLTIRVGAAEYAAR